MNGDQLQRRMMRVSRARRQVKANPSPSELDRLERTVTSYAQGLDSRVARALLERMLRGAA